jgi:RecB family endonuclease NucS
VNFSIGKYDLAATYYDMLSYAFEKHKALITKALSPAKKKRLEQISEKYEGFSNKTERITYYNQAKEKISPILVNEEKDLKVLLQQNHEMLENTLECKLKYMGEEIRPTKMERDRCDLLYKSEKVLYIIELKKDQADHSVVTQIDKYMKYFWQTAFTLDHEYVNGVVIAAKYSDYAYENLKNNSIKCFQYDLSERFSLIKI